MTFGGWRAGKKAVLLVSLERERCEAMLSRAGGRRGQPPLVRQQLPLGLGSLGSDQDRATLAQALAKMAAQAGATEMLCCLPSTVASFHQTPAPEGLAQRLRWSLSEHLVGLTPFAPDQVRAAVLRSPKPLPWLVTVVPRRLADDVARLATDSGLRLVGLAPRVSCLARALAGVAGREANSGLLYADDAGVDWLLLDRGRLVSLGRQMATGRPERDAEHLLGQILPQWADQRRAVLSFCGPDGAQLRQRLAALDLGRVAPGLDIALTAMARSEVLPPGLDWPCLPLLGLDRRAGGGPPLMDLTPDIAAGGWLESRRATTWLAATALLAVVALSAGQAWRQWRAMDLAQDQVRDLRQELAGLGQAKKRAMGGDGLAPATAALAQRGRGLRLLHRLSQIMPGEARVTELAYAADQVRLRVRTTVPREVAQALDNQPDLRLEAISDQRTPDDDQTFIQTIILNLTEFR